MRQAYLPIAGIFLHFCEDIMTRILHFTVAGMLLGSVSLAQDAAKQGDPVLLMPVFSLEAIEVNGVPIANGPAAKVSVAPGDVITAKIYIRNWSPQGEKLRGFQAKIDPAGYTSGTSGSVKPRGHNPGTQNDANAFIDTKDPHFVHYGQDSIPLVDSGSDGYRWLNVILDPEKAPVAAQDSKKYSCGTVKFQPSADAAGTFTIAFMQENMASGLLDPANTPIVPLGFESLQVEVKPGVKWLRIESSDPPDGAVDGRLVQASGGKDDKTWKSILLQFSGEVGEIAASDLEISDGSSSPPKLVKVESNESQVLATLDKPIRSGAWTTIKHKSSGTFTRVGRLAGDVNSSGRCDADDLMVLLGGLNGTQKLPLYSADLNSDESVKADDALRLIDLLTQKRARKEARIR